MKRLLSRRFASLTALVFLTLLSGCGEKLPPLVPVGGKITLDGKPFTDGMLTLIPEEKNLSGLSIIGIIDSTGTYTVKTNGKDGAPEGTYKITVTATNLKADPSAKKGSVPKPPFNMKFAEFKKTTLGFQVVANSAAGAYDLKLTK